MIGVNAWKHFRLTRTVLEGYSLLERLRNGEDVVSDHETWQTAAAEFLKLNYEEKPRSKFLFERHGTGKFARPPSEPTLLEERIGRQIETLNELSQKADA